MPTGQITWITYEGQTRSINGWATHLGFSYKTLWARLHKGWSLPEAFTVPLWRRRSERQLALPGIAPHIRGPAIARDGQWVALAPWQAQTKEE
jgi:hypothetical protein